uniref:Endothelial cell adhesion molecule n=1 Tax=Pavo cristatus TaxID=9049 RepID=A0A8C9G7X8_PAVCR
MGVAGVAPSQRRAEPFWGAGVHPQCLREGASRVLGGEAAVGGKLCPASGEPFPSWGRRKDFLPAQPPGDNGTFLFLALEQGVVLTISGALFCFVFFLFCFILFLYNWYPGLRRVPFSCRAGVCSAVLEVHVGTGSVYSVEGEGAVLPAWYTSSSQKKPYIKVFSLQILTYLDGEVKVEETELKPRVGFLHPVLTHNISLFINATREHDSGQYICSVNVVDDIISPVRNMAIINLTVLVPPAPPACRLKGSPTVGANVTLSCASQKGKPSPLYKWQRQEPTKQVFFPPAQDRARGTLKLTNLSLDMSGLYECEAENRAGSAKCSIILEVHSSECVPTGLGRGAQSLRWDRREAKNSPTCLSWEDAVAPKTPTWTRTRPADTISKTSTLSSIVGSRDRPYGASPPSDTASVLTAAGSYRGPPRAGAHPPPVAPPGGLPPSSLARAGAVPVMVPAQSRAGSLV